VRKCQICGHGRGISTEFEASEKDVSPVTVTICRRCNAFLDGIDGDDRSDELVVWEASFGSTLEALGLT